MTAKPPLLAAALVAATGAGLLGFAACSDNTNNTAKPRTALERSNLDPTDPDVALAQAIVQQMTLEEKVQQMSGPAFNLTSNHEQADNVRLGIPGWRYLNGPRGVSWENNDYGTTVYPIAEARAASFDTELERLIGKAMADEMRLLGRHVLEGPFVNQVMHPRGGRAQEGYGEDTYLLGRFAVAAVVGAQYDPAVADPKDPAQVINPNTYIVQAVPKHFAANNIENQRIYSNSVLDERTLREVYLPHFRKTVEAGTGAVMAAYNRVNGKYSCNNDHLLRDILKDEWKFKGWVMSDWYANGNTLESPPAGLDVEMPFSTGTVPSLFSKTYYYGSNLVTAVNSGLVAMTYVDEAALRLIYAKVHYKVATKWQHDTSAVPWAPIGDNWQPRKTKSEHNQLLALRAAREGMVLLKNGPTRALADDVLPLNRGTTSKIALVGKFAADELTGDRGSSNAKVVDPALVITPLEGVAAALPAGTVFAHEAINDTTKAAVAAADAVVVIAAYFPADLLRSTSGEEGEWKDRVSMDLPQRDLDNIAAALALKAQKPSLKVIVVVKSGGVPVVHNWIAGVDAVIQAWYGGMREGQALAEILFGDVVPSGKLPQSIPQLESDLPPFNAETVGDLNYDYYHGYRWLDKHGHTPEFAFGFGQSYTTFTYSNLAVATPTVGDTGTVQLTVDVKNTGPVKGTEIVQAYVGFDNTKVTDTWGRPKKQLFGFARAEDVAPNETRHVSISIDVKDLAYWDVAGKAMKVEKIAYPLYVGPSSDLTDAQMQTSSFTVQ